MKRAFGVYVVATADGKTSLVRAYRGPSSDRTLALAILVHVPRWPG